MVLICPRCQRANPRAAVFCHHDGAVLNPAGSSVSLLARPVVFPSGVSCRSVEDLGGALAQNWPEARQMLADGSLAGLLRESMRLDLARTADDARTQSDLDLALYQLLDRLPRSPGARPKLEVYPRRLVLGPYPVGGQHRSSIRIANRGEGILQGVVRCDGQTPWLRLAEQASPTEIPIRTEQEQSIDLWIDTRGLASGEIVGSKLIVVTGGGLVEVPISLELTVHRYPTAPFAAATSPRRLAELMRRHQREAATALENGEVRRWFAANGWAYPVPGTPAGGMAAVQQFFECLGLAHPPALELASPVILLASDNGQPVRGEVLLRTEVRKWVYAQVEDHSSWIRPEQTTSHGVQQASIGFEVETARLPEGTAEGTIQVTGNGGVRMTTRVRVTVQHPSSGLGQGWMHALVVGGLCLLLYRIVAVLPGDVFGRMLGGSAEAGSLSSWLTAPGSGDSFLRRFVLATFWLGGPVGWLWAWRRGGTRLDLVGGALAGLAAGLALTATLGCLLILGDELPRRLLAVLTGGRRDLSAGLATILWLCLACGCWLILGMLLGLLGALFGKAGLQGLQMLATPLREFCRRVGAKKWVELLCFRQTW